MDPYLGEVRLFGGNFAPREWHFCDGSLLPISEHEALYHLLGTTYGGDGVSTFALPDLRGRAPIHVGPGYALGGSGGVEAVTLSEAENPSHSHQYVASLKAATEKSPDGAFVGTAPKGAVFRIATGAVHFSPAALAPSGGQPHANVQPFQCVNYIIAIAGIYPRPA